MILPQNTTYYHIISFIYVYAQHAQHCFRCLCHLPVPSCLYCACLKTKFPSSPTHFRNTGVHCAATVVVDVAKNRAYHVFYIFLPLKQRKNKPIILFDLEQIRLDLNNLLQIKVRSNDSPRTKIHLNKILQTNIQLNIPCQITILQLFFKKFLK